MHQLTKLNIPAHIANLARTSKSCIAACCGERVASAAATSFSIRGCFPTLALLARACLESVLVSFEVRLGIGFDSAFELVLVEESYLLSNSNSIISFFGIKACYQVSDRKLFIAEIQLKFRLHIQDKVSANIT